jgi:transcriptional regulator with XRE-family HTH domain
MAVELQKLQTRLAEAIKVSSKSREQICTKLGIHLNTLGTYIAGKRPISLDHAYQIMQYIDLDPELLFSDHPIRRKLTGVAQIDQCLRLIVSAMDDEEDVAVDYFSPDYLCVSSDYAYHNREDETEKNGTDYHTLQLTKHEKSYGVDRITEHSSFGLRKADGWSCRPTIVFADVITQHCVTIFIRNKWTLDTKKWNNSTLYESFDHLFFTERIGEIAYGEKEPLINRKVWTPMPNFEDTRWYED